MPLIVWIIIFGLLMSAIALIGVISFSLSESAFKRLIMPLVSLAAGTLIGGAVFHLLPHSIAELGNRTVVYVSFMFGFVFLFMLEQFLHWHHCHKSPLKHKPVGYLILLADGLHNFVGGLSVGAAFVIDIKLGLITWFVAAAHEIPQELGDFGLLIHSGWTRNMALLFNFISALTFPLGGVLAYLVSGQLNMPIFLAFAAGNFLYIGATDLIPQLQQTKKTFDQVIQFLVFLTGLTILLILRLVV